MQRSLRFIIALILFGSAGIAAADHGHFGVGVVIGPGYYPPPYYYSPYYTPYYYRPVVVVPPAPVYVEQAPAAVAPPPAPAVNYWYFCPASRTYYPYVKECPAGWQKVPAQPQG